MVFTWFCSPAVHSRHWTQDSMVCSIWVLSSRLWYGNAMLYSLTHPLKNPWVSRFWLWRIRLLITLMLKASWWHSGKESAYQCRRSEFNPCVWKIPWRRKWQPTQVFLPGKCHGQEKKAWWAIVQRVAESETWLKWLNDKMFVKTSFLWDKRPRVELPALGITDSFAVLKGTAKQFCKEAVSFNTPTSNVWWLLFHILTSIWFYHNWVGSDTLLWL